MIEWIAAKMATAWVKVLVVVAALLMPICAVGWAVEAVELHGISIPLIWWHVDLVDGALAARDKAYAARDAALKDLGQSRANEKTLANGLNICNAHVDDLAKAAHKWALEAQDLIDAADQLRAGLAKNSKAIAGIKSSDEKCPVADTVFQMGFK